MDPVPPADIPHSPRCLVSEAQETRGDDREIKRGIAWQSVTLNNT